MNDLIRLKASLNTQHPKSTWTNRLHFTRHFRNGEKSKYAQQTRMQSGAPISKRKLQVRVCKMPRLRRTGLHTEPVTGDDPVDLTILKVTRASELLPWRY
jgi:hypothetical protein